MVEFERRLEVAGKGVYLDGIRYADDDPNVEIASRSLDPDEAGRRPRDTLSGAKAAVVHIRAGLDRAAGG